MSSAESAHAEDVGRAWNALRRDFVFLVEFLSGFLVLDDERNQQRARRFSRNWKRLCDLDLDVAARAFHGVEWVHMSMRIADDRAQARRLSRLQDMLDAAEFGRAANPDAEAETLRELGDLGDEAIRRLTDDDPGGEG